MGASGVLKGVAGVTWPTRDLAETRRFYSALIGCEPVYDTQYLLMFNMEGTFVAFAPDMRPDPPMHEGVLLSWHVDDLGAAIAAAERLGAQVVLARRKDEDGRESATLRDPLGQQFELTVVRAERRSVADG